MRKPRDLVKCDLDLQHQVSNTFNFSHLTMYWKKFVDFDTYSNKINPEKLVVIMTFMVKGLGHSADALELPYVTEYTS